jgi:hypothetical protein
MSDTYIPRGAGKRQLARSVAFDLDNGNGITIDDVVLKHSQAIRIDAARIVYVDAATETVAGGTAQVGTTLGGDELVAATAYADTSAIGTTTALVLDSTAVPAGTSIFVRHTGVDATQAGSAVVELEYTVLP